MSAKVCDLCDLPILKGEEHFGNTRFEHTNLRSCVDRLTEERAGKAALIARLCEALEPFAINVRNVLTQVRDDGEICVEALIPLGDIARACSALAAAAQARKGETK